MPGTNGGPKRPQNTMGTNGTNGKNLWELKKKQPAHLAGQRTTFDHS